MIKPSIPLSTYERFLVESKELHHPYIRVGQAFHIYMKAHRTHQTKEWWDKLWETDGVDAHEMINDVIDWNN